MGNYEHALSIPADAIKADKEKLAGGLKGYNPMTADEIIAEPYAVGKRFTVRPDDPYNRFTIESKGAELKLYDGRMNHNNGWFVISSEVPEGKTEKAIQWIITPNLVEDWLYTPVIQVSQVGYHPNAEKKAVIELDSRDTKREKAVLYKITENGDEEILCADCEEWGRFLRYNYLKFDFTDIKEESLYKICYGNVESAVFRVAEDIYDRWVFTEENPVRELITAAQIAAASRAIEGFNDTLSVQALAAAQELYEMTDGGGSAEGAKVHAAIELYLATEEQKYKEFLLAEKEYIVKNIKNMGWIVCRVIDRMESTEFTEDIREAMLELKKQFEEESKETPYRIPYRPHIWGAGWAIQRLGMEYYFLHKAFPDVFEPNLLLNALNFILGCHPGANTVSFASGVGARSATVAYGMNRADWSYIPGGVISGTALIRPDFPELLEFPYLWQQTEYVLGGGSSDYMFLVLAAQQLLCEK